MKSITIRMSLAIGILTIAATRVLPEPKQPAAVQAKTGVIRGVVTRLGTSEPIPGVQVSATRGSMAAPEERESAQSIIDAARAHGIMLPPVFQAQVDAAVIAAAKPFTATTDSAGRFVITGLPPGRYYIRGEREGYLGPEMNNRSLPYVEDGATLVAGQETRDLAFKMVLGARIQGRVLDSQGRPAVGASVLVFSRRYLTGAPVLYGRPGAKVNDRGEYRLPWLPPGEFYVGVEPVTSDVPGKAVSSGVSDAPTYYPGTVDISSALLFVLRGGEDLPGIDISLRSTPRIKVSGRVTSIVPIAQVGNAGHKVTPEVTVFLWCSDKNAIEARVYGATVSLDSPANGQFEITGVRPGTYDLYATVSTYDGSRQTMAAVSAGTQPAAYFGRTSIDAGSQDLSGISVVLRQGVEVKAHVTVDGRAISTVAAVTVNMRPADSAKPVYGSVVAQIARPDGSIIMPFVNEGLYRFSVYFMAAAGVPNLSRAYVEDIREGDASVYDGIRIDTERGRAIEVAVKTNGGSINGTVIDAEQKPKAGASVVMVPAPQRRQNLAWYKTATSNAVGRFSISGLAPGEYKVFAWERSPDTAYMDSAFLAKYEERGRAVTVNPASTTSAQITVIPAGN